MHTEFNRLFGLRKNVVRKQPMPHPVNKFPLWYYALGKSGGSEQGVAGWRQQYHRAFEDTNKEAAGSIREPWVSW